MKQKNRNLYLVIIGIAVVLFFIYSMMLYRSGIIDAMDLKMGCIYMAMMTFFGLILAFVKSPWIEKRRNDSLDPELLEVPRGSEGIIFEVLTGLILAVAWIVAIASDRFWIIENFFSYLSPVIMFMLTFITITILFMVYLPSFKSKIRKCTNEKQLAIKVRMFRILAVELALFVLAYDIPLDYYNPAIFYIFVVVFIATIVVFRYLIYKAR